MTATPTMLALVQEYLAFRRTLGFALGTAGQELLLFARYAERTGHRGPVTTELAVRWAQLPAQASPAYWAWRLQAVRLFAQHRALEDPRTEVPPAGLLGPTYRRGQPHTSTPPTKSRRSCGPPAHSAAGCAPTRAAPCSGSWPPPAAGR
jgi:hypothetical protein